VIYNGDAETSRVPHGWRTLLTHNANLMPSEDTDTPHPWEKLYVPNITGIMTGTT
jgi:NADH:ubiquinone oxidoreductase subunit